MEKRGLDHSAYGGIDGKDYVPFIPADKAMPEITIVSMVMGIIFAMLFAAANTYLGLKVGMTIAAGIPASVLATGILKGLFKRNNVLEANMIQSIAAMGEALAGGIIFTLPAIIIWGLQLRLSTIVVATLLGGLIGIFFVVPLRKYLTVEEHGKLMFPESMAAAEILATGSSGGTGLKTVLLGLSTGGLYKLLSGGLAFWLEDPEWTIRPIQSTIFGVNVLASLAGVGFIIGIEGALYMFAGAVVAWFGFIPLIKYVGEGLTSPLFPSTQLISQMNASAIWSNYIRYVGAGAVAAGGFISLGKSLPTIIRSFRSAMGGFGSATTTKRTDLDVPIYWVIGAGVFVFLLAWVLPMVSIGPIGSILVVLFAFFFAVVSAQMCGIIGASNNPVSGMTIASLLFITAILKATGFTAQRGMTASILAGAIVCIAIAVSGDAAQALKVTHIIGGTPKRVEFSMYAGVIFGSVVSGLVLLMLNHTYGMGSQAVPAPQATLMSMVVKGVMTAQLPWILVIIGVAFGVMCALMGLPVLPVALGLYLPIDLSAGILVGGLVRSLVERRFRKNPEKLKLKVEKGVLLASGLVAGDAIMGIVIAIFASLSINIAFGSKILPGLTGSPYTAMVLYLLLAFWMYWFTVKRDKKENG
ncbi:OPT oligopeptide transporter protein [Peptococcaceae bacterium CEB3]|nr:OPT oligopeptide transporter protein [Peptococcaceae bacterium CEB3]